MRFVSNGIPMKVIVGPDRHGIEHQIKSISYYADRALTTKLDWSLVRYVVFIFLLQQVSFFSGWFSGSSGQLSERVIRLSSFLSFRSMSKRSTSSNSNSPLTYSVTFPSFIFSKITSVKALVTGDLVLSS